MYYLTYDHQQQIECEINYQSRKFDYNVTPKQTNDWIEKHKKPLDDHFNEKDLLLIIDDKDHLYKNLFNSQYEHIDEFIVSKMDLIPNHIKELLINSEYISNLIYKSKKSKIQRELDNKTYLSDLSDKDIELNNSQFDEKTDLELHIDEIK